MSRVFDVLFNAGQDEGADRIALPEGSFRLLQNGRITRDGRIEVRPQYVALGAGTVSSDGASFTALDVTTFEDKLIAIGTPAGGTYPKGLFTYLGSGAAAPWKGLFDTSISYATLPIMTDIETIWQTPAGFYPDTYDVAYTNGHVCICQTFAGNAAKVFILRDGVVINTLSLGSTINSLRVVGCGNTFVLLSRNSSNNVEGQTYDTSSATATWSAAATLNGVGGGAITGVTTWDACAVPGSTTDFIIAVPRPATPRMEVRRYSFSTMASATVWANTAVGTTVGNCGLCADQATNSVGFGYISANNVLLFTMNMTSGASTTGPTSVIGPATSDGNAVGSPALSIVSSANIAVQCQTGSGLDSVFDVRAISGHALISHGTFEQTFLVSKLFNVERSASLKEPFSIGTFRTGTLNGVGALWGTSIIGSVSGYLTEARLNYNVSDSLVGIFQAPYHGRPSVAWDGSGNFWGAMAVLDDSRLGTNGAGTPQVVRWKGGSPARRQTAEMQGGLYIAGGFVGYYDGALMVEANFFETPTIRAFTQGTAGSLTQLATYTYIAMWEWTDAKGRVHRSEPSFPTPFTLTGANDDLTVEMSSAHTFRNIDYQGSGSLVQSVLFRNVPGDSVFYRVGQTPQTVGEVGAPPTTLQDTTSDTNLQIRPIIYIQSQKPVVNVAPPACRFLAAGRDRIIYGGLQDPYLVVFSQLPFPNEPMENTDFSSEFAYQVRLPEKVTGVSGFGDSYVAFTDEGIYEIPGEGPQRNGTGEFFLPRAIYSDGGCIDWRSIVDTAGGLFFQMAADKLYRIKPSGEIDFVGRRVRDTLLTYPVVRAAALCTETQRVAFAVVDNDTTPTGGGILVYDLVQDAWSFDNVGVITGLCEFDGLIAYVQGGLVYLEQSAAGVGSGALPSLSIRTGSFRLFPASGQGTICKVTLQGTYLGDSTIEGFISYDDGKTWTSMGTQAATAANLFNPVTGNAMSSGDPVTIVFTPNRREVDRFALRFDCTNGTNTGGTRLHMLSLEVEANEFTTRQPGRNQR